MMNRYSASCLAIVLGLAFTGCSQQESGAAKQEEPAKAEPAAAASASAGERIPVHLDPRNAKSVLDQVERTAQEAEQTGKTMRDELDRIQ